MKAKCEEVRKMDFEELKDQPSYIQGGEMMEYQKEGMK